MSIFFRKYPVLIPVCLYSLGVISAWNIYRDDNWPSIVQVFLCFCTSFLICSITIFCSRLKSFFLSLLLFTTGFANATWRHAVISKEDIRNILDNNPKIVTIAGKIKGQPTLKVFNETKGSKTNTSVYIEIFGVKLQDSLEYKTAQGLIFCNFPGILPDSFSDGVIVKVNGLIKRPDQPIAEELFNIPEILRAKGIWFYLKTDTLSDWKVIEKSNSWFKELPKKFISSCMSILSRGLDPDSPSTQLRYSMLLGWRTPLTDEVSRPFMLTGTMHIFAISGLHIVLITETIIALFRILRVPLNISGLITLPLTWIYSWLTGWQASAVRAAVMVSVIVAGRILKRPSNLINSLAFAAFIILLFDPFQIFLPSFQLSFLVVIGIAIFAIPIIEYSKKLLSPNPFIPSSYLPKYKLRVYKFINNLVQGIAISAAAFLIIMPMIAWYFYLVTPINFIANLFIVPLALLVIISGLGSLICSVCSNFLTELFNNSGWFFMFLIQKIIDWFTHWPYASFYISKPTFLMVVTYYLGIILLVYLFKIKPWATPKKLVISIIFSISWFIILAVKTSQQDLIIIPALKTGTSIICKINGQIGLIDTGSQKEASTATIPLLNALGINTIDYLVLTHGDQLHVSATEEISKMRKIRKLYTVQNRPYSSSLAKAMTQSIDTSVSLASKGTNIGPWLVLHPPKDISFKKTDDTAIVLFGEFHGLKILLLSDLGPKGQEILMNTPITNVDIAVCGIPYDGQPLEDALLSQIKPKVVIIKSSDIPYKENLSLAQLKRMRSHGLKVIETKDVGTIKINLKSKSLTFSNENKKPCALNI